MSGFECRCGERINLSPIPNPQGFTVISERLEEQLIEKIVSAYREDTSKEEFEKHLYMLFTHLQTPGILQMYECPNCGRLITYARASDSKPMFWFQLEGKNYPERADSLRSLVERLQSGDFPFKWQEISAHEE